VGLDCARDIPLHRINGVHLQNTAALYNTNNSSHSCPYFFKPGWAIRGRRSSGNDGMLNIEIDKRLLRAIAAFAVITFVVSIMFLFPYFPEVFRFPWKIP